jgi:hypothetical protein
MRQQTEIHSVEMPSGTANAIGKAQFTLKFKVVYGVNWFKNGFTPCSLSPL